MGNLLLLSIIIVAMVIPARAARGADPKKAFKTAMRNMVIYGLFYIFAVMYIYPRIN